MGPSPHLWFLDAEDRLLGQNNKSLWVPALIVWFSMQNSDFWTRITSLYVAQTSPVVLCMKNSVIRIRMTSLYGFQPSSVVLCMQNSDFRTWLTSLYETQTSSVVLSTHINVLSKRTERLYWFQPSPVVLCIKNKDFRTRITNLYGSQPSSVVFACKAAPFGSELQVSMGSRPHLSYCACKTAWLSPENLSLWVPVLTCWF